MNDTNQAVTYVYAIDDGPSSGQIEEVAKALSAAQAAMKPAFKDSRNPRFASEYASLAQVIEASAEALGKHGLSILPKISWSGDKLTMRSILLHSSGQWIDCGTLESLVVVPPPGQGKSESRINALQAAGNNITYLLRYSSGAICRLQIQKDTDGNGHPEPEQPASREYIPPEPEPAPESPPKTDQTRMRVLNALQAAPGQPNRDLVTRYLRAKAQVAGADGQPESWALDFVPNTPRLVRELGAEIAKWEIEQSGGEK